MDADRIKTLKIRLVHDWLTGMRGGEKVLELFCQRFPQAPLHTLLYNKGSVTDIISNRTIVTSPLQHFPFSRTKYRHYLPLFPIFAETNKVSDGDLIISSSHAVAKAMVEKTKNKKCLHICYIHTPMRYVWDRFDDYFGPERVGSFLSRFFFWPIAKLLRVYDVFTTKRVDVFIANSSFVAERVKSIYKREAFVIPPPVDLELFRSTERDPQSWFLIVTALVPYKRTEQGVKACAALGQKLKIVGTGPEEKSLRKLARDLNADVEFLGFVKDNDLANLYRMGRALLFPGVEDFGIVPLEAIAAGCPVIALKEGGVLDSMTSETAVFYETPTEEGLKEAILEFEKRTFDISKLKARATEFSHTSFLEKFEKILDLSLRDFLK
jgi:glycosyltransferase involved in cell wall biosynthesis